MNIRVSPEELCADRMSATHVERAVEAIDTDGYVEDYGLGEGWSEGDHKVLVMLVSKVGLKVSK